VNQEAPKPVSRETRRVLLAWLFGTATLDELCARDLRELVTGAIACGIEAHLLWRTMQMPAARQPDAATADRLRTLLKMRCLQNAAHNLQTDAQARRLCAGLQSAGIPVMLLKGTALRARYPELAGRPQCDTDVLVRRGDLGRAEAVVREAGYRVDEKLFTREQYLEEHFDLRMIKDDNAVELHWTMSNECAAGAIERTWERAEPIDWGGTPVWLPCVEDQVVFTQVHICRHLFVRGLRWFGDMLFEIERWPDLAPRLEKVRREWPARMVYAPVKVAADQGLAPDRQAAEVLAAASKLVYFLLGSLARAALFEEKWCGFPQWHFNAALANWLTHESLSLPAAIAQTVAAKMMGRKVTPWA
jgi:hypothetical protein